MPGRRSHHYRWTSLNVQLGRLTSSQGLCLREKITRQDVSYYPDLELSAEIERLEILAVESWGRWNEEIRKRGVVFESGRETWEYRGVPRYLSRVIKTFLSYIKGASSTCFPFIHHTHWTRIYYRGVFFHSHSTLQLSLKHISFTLLYTFSRNYHRTLRIFSTLSYQKWPHKSKSRLPTAQTNEMLQKWIKVLVLVSNTPSL